MLTLDLSRNHPINLSKLLFEKLLFLESARGPLRPKPEKALALPPLTGSHASGLGFEASTRAYHQQAPQGVHCIAQNLGVCSLRPVFPVSSGGRSFQRFAGGTAVTGTAGLVTLELIGPRAGVAFQPGGNRRESRGNLFAGYFLLRNRQGMRESNQPIHHRSGMVE